MKEHVSLRQRVMSVLSNHSERFLEKMQLKGFCICAAELQKWKDGMHNGVKTKMVRLSEKSATLRPVSICVVAVPYGNRCVHEGYLKDVPYPFSNKKEKGLVSIPKSAKRKQNS